MGTAIELADLVELFAVRGALGSFMTSRFTTFCVSKKTYGYEQRGYGWTELTEPHLRTDNIDVALSFVAIEDGIFEVKGLFAAASSADYVAFFLPAHINNIGICRPRHRDDSAVHLDRCR